MRFGFVFTEKYVICHAECTETIMNEPVGLDNSIQQF